MDMEWEMRTRWERERGGTRTRGNKNKGGHTGLGPDRSYPELTGVVSEQVLTHTLVLTCTFTPLRLTHQDEHGQEDKNLIWNIPELSTGDNNKH